MYLDILKQKVLVFDGAMGSNLQAQNLSLEDWGGAQFENCSENLLYTRPEAIEKVHLGFLEAGCDVIETNSFGGGEVVLQEFGIADKAYDTNRLRSLLAERGIEAVRLIAATAVDRDRARHRDALADAVRGLRGLPDEHPARGGGPGRVAGAWRARSSARSLAPRGSPGGSVRAWSRVRPRRALRLSRNRARAPV